MTVQDNSFEPDAKGAHVHGKGTGGLALGALAGAVLVVLAVVGYLFATRDTAPVLTQADYEAALARWEKNGPADYELDVTIAGNRPGRVHVEVRGGEVVRMTRDDVEPKQRRTWDVWSVPGMFDTIGQELDNSRDPARAFNTPSASQMVMWADFDPKLGYPTRYDRVVLGATFETHWRVTNFRNLVGAK